MKVLFPETVTFFSSVKNLVWFSELLHSTGSVTGRKGNGGGRAKSWVVTDAIERSLACPSQCANRSVPQGRAQDLETRKIAFSTSLCFSLPLFCLFYPLTSSLFSKQVLDFWSFYLHTFQITGSLRKGRQSVRKPG